MDLNHSCHSFGRANRYNLFPMFVFQLIGISGEGSPTKISSRFFPKELQYFTSTYMHDGLHVTWVQGRTKFCLKVTHNYFPSYSIFTLDKIVRCGKRAQLLA